MNEAFRVEYEERERERERVRKGRNIVLFLRDRPIYSRRDPFRIEYTTEAKITELHYRVSERCSPLAVGLVLAFR